LGSKLEGKIFDAERWQVFLSSVGTEFVHEAVFICSGFP
jgi:hypothetical protein